MNIVEVLLVFVGIPLGVTVVLAALIYGPTMVRQGTKYRPGRPWTFEPVWYLPHPEADGLQSHAVPSGATAVTAAGGSSITYGGASGEW